MTLSDSLKRFRKYCKLTQVQAAQAANISERNYQAYESGKVTPSAKVIIDLSKSTGVSADFILGLSDIPTSH